MDLNYLFHRHQVSLMRAGEATSVEARIAHEALARCYAVMIEDNRTDRPEQDMAPLPARLATEAFTAAS